MIGKKITYKSKYNDNAISAVVLDKFEDIERVRVNLASGQGGQFQTENPVVVTYYLVKIGETTQITNIKPSQILSVED